MISFRRIRPNPRKCSTNALIGFRHTVSFTQLKSLLSGKN